MTPSTDSLKARADVGPHRAKPTRASKIPKNLGKEIPKGRDFSLFLLKLEKKTHTHTKKKKVWDFLRDAPRTSRLSHRIPRDYCGKAAGSGTKLEFPGKRNWRG